jgi:hypothetical protein
MTIRTMYLLVCIALLACTVATQYATSPGATSTSSDRAASAVAATPAVSFEAAPAVAAPANPGYGTSAQAPAVASAPSWRGHLVDDRRHVHGVERIGDEP